MEDPPALNLTDISPLALRTDQPADANHTDYPKSRHEQPPRSVNGARPHLASRTGAFRFGLVLGSAQLTPLAQARLDGDGSSAKRPYTRPAATGS